MCFFKSAATSELDDTVGDIRALVSDVQNEIIREVEGASNLTICQPCWLSRFT